ncbi:MAG TPA: mannose-1-phosphate guanylyltransferase [Candidatus Baltobacteraceae bacterium]|nr:mannose-1-phosphate guanylyltransferase [Candidatus Baltobacteraceae bacterium]
MNRLFVVVLAGGSGERFWPLSTPSHPKQFPALLENQSFFQRTVERAIRLVGAERVLVATRDDLWPVVHEQVPDLPAENCIREPEGRDTAACIGLAALVVEQRQPGARMLVTPSDHFITPFHAFEETIRQATALLDRVDGLVTLGIPPTGPETGYGYILAGGVVPEHAAARRCERFTEKPDRTTAERFVADGRYYWNSGIFLWTAATFLKHMAVHLPEHWRVLEAIRPALGTAEEQAVLARRFPEMPKVSVDIGVLEKAAEVFMVPATFAWDDIGAWSALGRILPKDDSGNAVVGRHVGRDSHGCVIYSTSRPIATVGLDNIIVVETPLGILVCPKDRAQEVKHLVRALRENQ